MSTSWNRRLLLHNRDQSYDTQCAFPDVFCQHLVYFHAVQNSFGDVAFSLGCTEAGKTKHFFPQAYISAASDKKMDGTATAVPHPGNKTEAQNSLNPWITSVFTC